MNAAPTTSDPADPARAQSPTTGGDRALDYDAVRAELAALGITQADGTPYTRRQVQRLADDRKLPFFKAPDRRRMILRSELIATVTAWQADARRKQVTYRSEAERARRPARR